MEEKRKMKKMIRAFLAAILICLMMSANASAMPVCFTKVIPTIEVTTMDGQKKTIQSSVIQLIGRDSNGDGILFLDAQYYKVEAFSLKSLFPGVDIESLPVITEFATIGGGFGEIVFPMQNALIKLGYLEGTPDGSFGPKTKKAVKEFQEDVGL